MSKLPTEKSLEPRRRGRPPADVPSSTVSAWVPTPVHDRLISVANHRRCSVSALVRRFVVLQLRESE